METASDTTTAARSMEAASSTVRPSSRAKASNTYRFREEWLAAAIQMLRPMFEKAGSPIPELGRAAIGFPSKGSKGNCIGECWHGIASGDAHFEIFIRPDQSDPVDVLGVLTHELVHSAVPLGSGHGPVYKALALKIGLEGKMRHALPGMHLIEVLKGIAADLGPFPHASLNIEFRESAPRKKQKTNMLKAWCEGVKDETGKLTEACDYVCRLTATHAQKGAPICGVHETRMIIEWPAEDETGETGEEAIEEDGFKASQPPMGEEERGFKASRQPAGDGGVKASPPPPEPVAAFRLVAEGEVFQPGGHYRMNQTTGVTEVLAVPPATITEGETHGL